MIIGIYGEKRVGKDTTAKILSELLGLEIKSFAKIPKEIISKTLGISIELFENLKNENQYYRQMIINFAEIMKEKLGKDIWVKMLDKSDSFIISDLRFKEEVEAIKKINKNFIIIKIIDKNVKETDIHQFDYDFIIDNTKKDINILKEKCKNIIKEIK